MKSKLKLTLGAVLGMVAVSALSSEAFAVIRYVDADTEDETGRSCDSIDYPCKTIARALDYAFAGDIIKVYPGTYREHDLDIAHEITITAADRSNPPTIDAEGAGRHFTIDIPEPWTDATSNLAKIRNVSLVNGDAGSEAGGSISVDSGRLRLNTATLSGNSASHGGAIYCGWMNCEELIVKESVLENNAAEYGGGAIRTYGPTEIRSSAFLNNSSGGSGGAIAISEYHGAQYLDVSESEFEGNDSDGDGGAINSSVSPVTIAKSAFIRNEAVGLRWSDGRHGGGSAIYFGANQSSDEELVMTNSTFYDNHTGGGGAVYMTHGTVGAWANLAFRDNTAMEDGRHVYSQDSDIEVKNSYFYTTPELADIGLTDPCISTGPNFLIASVNNLWESGAVQWECYWSSTLLAGELTPNSLTPLGYHDGSTRSFLLKVGSNALNEGMNECPHPTTGVPLEDDQRGIERPLGLACDIGPIEQAYGARTGPGIDLPLDPVDF